MMHGITARAWLLCLLLGLSGVVPAQSADPVDYLELAARLVADGHHDRARAALRQVDTDDEEHDPVRYAMLLGLVALRSGDATTALAHFRDALSHQAAAGEDSSSEEERAARERTRQRIQLYLGQALFEAGEYRDSLAALAASGELGNGIAAVQALRAQAHWELEETEAAFSALALGEARFPEDHRFQRRRVFYLIQLGFYREAAARGLDYLGRINAGADDYLAIGSALRQSRQTDEALRVLEQGRLLFPADRRLNLELARTYLDRDQAGLAADIVTDLALRHPDLTAEAAELQQQAGRLNRALMLNAEVTDQAKKYRQRLSLMIALERWEHAASMGPALERLELLEDDSLRYAYAYALFKAGRYQRADQVLAPVRDGEVFRKSTQLRQAMERCRENRWQCL